MERGRQGTGEGAVEKTVNLVERQYRLWLDSQPPATWKTARSDKDALFRHCCKMRVGKAVTWPLKPHRSSLIFPNTEHVFVYKAQEPMTTLVEY